MRGVIETMGKLLALVWLVTFVVFLYGRNSFVFKLPKHMNGVAVVDFARHDLPPVRLGERVIDLMSGMHFDCLLQDTPTEMRPPSIILFSGYESCANADAQLKFTTLAESKLPSRERLLIARYDIDANPHRAWFKFTPEMDLQKRYKAKCGDIAFVPRGDVCNGFIEWCVKPREAGDAEGLTRVGCENFVDKCAELVKIYNPSKDGGENWVDWVMKMVEENGEPEISPVLGSYQDQNKWLRERDETTTDNELRNYYLVEAFPAFTEKGYLPMAIPKELNNWFIDFWNRRKRTRYTELWHAASTQLSFHETPTSFVSMDQEAVERDELANRIIKPIVEKWSKMNDLQLTSFYGIREYKKGNWLRNHIDRIETHVLSVTFSLGKQNTTNENDLLSAEDAAKQQQWPLEVVAFNGEIERYSHPPNTMVLYESSKLAHGRPYPNTGPGHLGAFCHFKPRNMNAAEAKEWDNIAEYAAQNQKHNGKRGVYRTSMVVEPKQKVFTKAPYGQDTGFESISNPKPKKKKKDDYAVSFENQSNRPLDLYWISPQDEYVLQGKVAPGAKATINTYVSHRFAWCEHGTKNVSPGRGIFEIEAGSRRYAYA